jgi:dTDP-glucose 4,6-dehydratase
MTASDAGSVLITGGAGFMGSALVRQWLADEPAGVVNIDKLTYAGLRESLDGVLDHPRHLLVPGDIADAALVRSVLVEHRPRAILHLAAETHVDRSIVEPPVFARTNVLGTCVLLDAATSYWKMLSPAERAAFRFLYVSTDEVFGSAASGEAFTASSPLQPNSPYAASKAAGEQMTFAFARTYGLPAVVVNPSNNYGPRQMPEKLIPKMILAAARLEALPVYGDGLQERDWIHVDDCCRAIRIVLRKGNVGQRYLIGSGECRTNLSVVAKVCELVDQWLGDGAHRHALVEHVSDRPGHDRRYLVDSGPLRRELGWRPLVDFGEGLVATVDWYLKASDWISAAESSLKMRESLSLG